MTITSNVEEMDGGRRPRTSCPHGVKLAIISVFS